MSTSMNIMEYGKREVIPPVHVPLFSTRPIAFEYCERSARVCLIMHYSEALPAP